MLRAGIKLIGSEGIDLKERLEINNGGIRAPSENTSSIKYLPNAYIPSNSWRALNQEELAEALNVQAVDDVKTTIRILTIDDSISDLVKRLGIENASSYAEINAEISDNIEVVSLLDQRLKMLIQDFERPAAERSTYIQGFFLSAPGRPTVTTDKSDRFTGLHIDYSVDFHRLYKTDTVNRLCINIGKEARYFQYINQSVEQLENMINEVEVHDFRSQYESRDLPGIVEKFFTHYPDYPILKFKLEPFEAYIAPSDNMIHDGNSLEMTEFDISLSLLGFLNVIEHSRTKEHAAVR